MTGPEKKTYRKRYLFARSVDEVVKQATKPLMSKQGKLYGALLGNWEQIVGADRAAVTRPERLQFATREGANDATLHLAVRPAVAPEMTYVLEQIIEQCARYFGYRAISRIVLHPVHGMFDQEPPPEKTQEPIVPLAPLDADVPREMRDVLTRMAARYVSPIVKKDEAG